jgi:diketogulonate reductase-like aldo/keto reductase
MFGLGTYHMHEASLIRKAGSEMGYRFFDCASFYKNEEVVGEALKGILQEDKAASREDLFVVSKVWFDEVEDVEAACRRSLEKLGLDYLDLYLVHWPIAMKEVEQDGEKQYEKLNLPMYKIWA